MSKPTTSMPCDFRLAHPERSYRFVFAALVAFVGAVLLPTSAQAQDPGYAAAAVAIGFAPSGGTTVGGAVTIGFQSAGGDSLGRGVTIAFQNATTTANGGAAITIGFASPVNPSTQLGMPRNSAFNADPVNTATGNYVFEHTDLSLPGRGTGLAFVRFYNSLDSTDGPLGPGWTHSYNVTLTVNGTDQSVGVRWGDGHTDYYDKIGSLYVARHPGAFDTLSSAGGGTFVLLQKSQTQWHFTSAGRVDTITDRNGNVLALTYDVSGRLATVLEPGGRTLSLAYDGAGRITAVTDPLPRTVAFSYDVAGQLHTVTDVDGGIETYTYDANEQLLTATDPRGAVYVTNTYDAAKRVVTWQADAKGNRFEFAYAPDTGQTTITDPLEQSSVDAHDVRKRLIRRTDRLGHSVSYTYDDQNNRTSITDQNGHSTSYTYDLLGNVRGKLDALGQSTTITYDLLNNPLTRTDESGAVTRFTYDSDGNLLTARDPLDHVSTMTYDAYGQVLNITDARGGIVTNSWDAAGNLISVTDPTGAVTTFTYDAAGRKLSVTDARGHATQFTHDGSGHILTTTDPLGSVVTNVYDANANRTQTTDARGGITAFAYDVNNLLTTVTDALGGVTRHTYDALDRRITTTDALDQVTIFAYDAEGRLTQTTDPAGGVTQAGYDGVGNKTAVTDANGHTTAFTYDALNRLVKTANPLGQATLHAYDPLGRATRTTDAAGRITTFVYDAAGRLTLVTDPAGGTAGYIYDSVGNRLTVTDPKSQTTTLTYDAANRLLTSTDSIGGVASNTYDPVGNRIAVTDAKGATLAYTYDEVNRLTAIQPPTGAVTTFAYDPAGNRTGMVDAIGTTTSTFDALHRLTRYVDEYGQAIEYEYDAAGNRTALIYPDGERVVYAFDEAQRLTQVTDWAGRVTEYVYDAAGRLTSTANANGTTVTAGYDAAGRLTNLANRRGDTTVLAAYAYTLDLVGNRTAVVQEEPLAAVAATTSVLYTYNAANQIQTAGATTFTSDPNGNLTSRVAPTRTTTFSWDVHDRLTQVTDGASTAQYVYSGLGTRLARTIDGTTIRFVTDPQPALSQVLVETDPAGVPIARYVYGLGLVARIDAAGTALTYHSDPRGSTVALTDATQVMVNRYAYDEFGAVRQSQETVSQPFQYVGQFGVMQEPDGMLFMRARYYLTDEGRFLSVDPAPTFVTSQDLNLFAYANSNPVMNTDPSGLTWWEPAAMDVAVHASRAATTSLAQRWLGRVANQQGFDLWGAAAAKTWKVVPLVSVAMTFGDQLGKHWDDPGMYWQEKWSRAFLAAGESSLLDAGALIAGGGLGFATSVGGGIALDRSLDWQMDFMNKMINKVYDWRFGDESIVTTPERRELYRPMSSTTQKLKRDARR